MSTWLFAAERALGRHGCWIHRGGEVCFRGADFEIVKIDGSLNHMMLAYQRPLSNKIPNLDSYELQVRFRGGKLYIRFIC